MRMPKGLYVAIPAGDSLPTQTEMEIPFITGFFVPRTWTTIEAAEGVFNWVGFDQLVADCATYNKVCVLAVATSLINDGVAGTQEYIPSWWTGDTYTCQNGDIGPITWDSYFVQRYRRVLIEMIKRYDSNPVVVGYALAGMGWAFQEISPPCRNAATQTDMEGYIAAPYLYTPQKVANAGFEYMSLIQNLSRKSIRFALGQTVDNTTSPPTKGVLTTRDFVIDPLKQKAISPKLRYKKSITSRNRISVLGRATYQHTNDLFVGKTNLRYVTADPSGIVNQTPLNNEEQIVVDAGSNAFWQTEVIANQGPDTPEQWEQCRLIAKGYQSHFVEIRRANIVDETLVDVLTAFQDTLVNG